MQLTIEPTVTIDRVEGVPCRLWTGTTNEGTPVHVWVRMLSPQTEDAVALSAFDHELEELPSVEKHPVEFDLRFVV